MAPSGSILKSWWAIAFLISLGHISALWQKFKDSSGIEEEEFFAYFGSSRKGFAIKIKEVKAFKPIDPEAIVSDFSPPQSFCYVKRSKMICEFSEE